MLNIPGGKTREFTWIYKTARGDAGEMVFSANASGKDRDSGKTVSFIPVESNVVMVQAPANLTATAAVSPAQVSEDQDIDIVITMTNTGEAIANDVTPSILSRPVNGYISAADPVNATIPGGESQDFTWIYTSADGDAGDIVFSGSVAGRDHK